MNSTLKDIRILIWDFDGTLYKAKPQLWESVRAAEYQVIENHTGWDRTKVEGEFKKLHMNPIPSATAIVAKLSGISTTDAAREMEGFYDRQPYLSRDTRLIDVFHRLSGFRHFMLANGVKRNIIACLDILGIGARQFEEIVTSETVGVNKPNPEGFLYILEKTLLPADTHMMIGDRVAVDLAPAKKLGMKTCLVWGSDALADISLPTVYDIADKLL